MLLAFFITGFLQWKIQCTVISWCVISSNFDFLNRTGFCVQGGREMAGEVRLELKRILLLIPKICWNFLDYFWYCSSSSVVFSYPFCFKIEKARKAKIYSFTFWFLVRRLSVWQLMHRYWRFFYASRWWKDGESIPSRV